MMVNRIDENVVYDPLLYNQLRNNRFLSAVNE